MKSISLFTGAGGLDIGLESAGFSPMICVELDEDACATLKFNRPNWRLLDPGDIHMHRPEEIIEQAGLRPKETVLLSAGPPCQPFSKAAMWVNGKLAGLADSRSKTLEAFINIVEAALPKALLLENVRGLSRPGINSAIELLESGIERINRRYGTRYRWSVIHINAADYGAPQIRERTYLLANRDGKIFQIPYRTHSSMGNREALKSYITSWDAIGKLDTDKWDEELNPKGKWAELLPSIPEGRNYLWHTNRGGGKPLFGWRTRFWSFLLKLAKERPSWTLPAHPGPATGPFHWKSRLLSRRELCRLQTFPDNYIIQGAHSSAQRQIGNAVPPLIGEIIGREICRQWFGVQNENNIKFALSYKKDLPDPYPARRVPKEYFYLIGNHSPHPGVGKGPRASKKTTPRE
jgi:DNA (cytosine-5)-methyltransferase 1